VIVVAEVLTLMELVELVAQGEVQVQLEV